MTHPLLQMQGISKRFGQTVANDCVDFTLQQGEIHAIVGENGAGKSTLMKILYGIHQPDAGQIYIAGQPMRIQSPRTAVRLGIGMVQQHFTLVPALTALENIVLAKEPRRYKLFLDRPKASHQIRNLSQRLGFRLDVNAEVADLSSGEQQYTEILKTLYHGAEILILDEPTAVLAPQEIEQLLEQMQELKREGKSLILITHKLAEVMAVADRVTVMRHGKAVATLERTATNATELAALMVGQARPANGFDDKPVTRSKQPFLVMKNVTLRSRLAQVNLELFGGEIVGIAGVEGNGQNELVEVVTGLRKADSGTITFRGTSLPCKSPAEIRRLGVAHLPADRHRYGISLDDRIAENLILGKHNQKGFLRYGFINRRRVRRFAQDALERYGVRGGAPQLSARALSGGNQQKLVVARELEGDPSLIVAAHPTRGLDIGAAEFVHQQLLAARARQAAILLISPDLSELLKLSDRIAVMYNGRITGVVRPSETDEAELGALMLGLASRPLPNAFA